MKFNMIDHILLIGYLVLLLVIGYFSGRKLKTAKEFALSDRPFGLITMIATIFASFLGGTVLFGVPEQMYKVGIIFLLCFSGNAINMWLVARTMIDKAVLYRDAVTLGDITYDMYGSFGRILIGVCTVLSSAGIVGAELSVIGAVGRDFLNIDSNLAISVGCVVLVLYSSFGGVRSVAFTDVIQFFVFAVVLPMVISIVLHRIGNLGDLWNALPDTHKSICRNDWGHYIALLLIYCCPVFDPPLIQRILIMGARSKEIAKKAFIFVSVLMLIYSVLLGILGCCGILIPNIKAESAFWTLVNSSLSPIMKSFLAIGIIAITMSLVDSNLNTGSISFVRDLMRNTFFPNMSDKTELRLMRFATVIIGAGGYYFATRFNDLLEIVFIANNFWMPMVVVPLYFGFYGLKVSGKVFILASVLSTFVTFYWMMYMPNDHAVESIIAGMVVDFVVMISGYFYENKIHKKIFSK